MRIGKYTIHKCKCKNQKDWAISFNIWSDGKKVYIEQYESYDSPKKQKIVLDPHEVCALIEALVDLKEDLNEH